MKDSLEEKKRRARVMIDALDTEMRALAVFIADHPELGFQEYEASRLLTGFLNKYGLKTELGIADMPTAFQAQIVKGPTPIVALLVEYDALPEIGHGCGHNIGGVGCCSRDRRIPADDPGDNPAARFSGGGRPCTGRGW